MIGHWSTRDLIVMVPYIRWYGPQERFEKRKTLHLGVTHALVPMASKRAHERCWSIASALTLVATRTRLHCVPSTRSDSDVDSRTPFHLRDSPVAVDTQYPRPTRPLQDCFPTDSSPYGAQNDEVGFPSTAQAREHEHNERRVHHEGCVCED